MNLAVPSIVAGLSVAAGLLSSAPVVQQEQHFEAHATQLDYLLFLPQGYETSQRDWPLILFLHGSNESGTDLSKVKRNGPPHYVESNPDFPFILVSPQTSGGWNTDAVMAL